MHLLNNTGFFVIGYILLMIPTYIMPWLGSNSAVVNAVGAAMSGVGPTPQWWAHAWCLTMLVVITWVRGGYVGRKYLPVFPFLAAVFDLTPGLNLIPLVPTILHLFAVVLGTMRDAQARMDAAASPVHARWAGKVAGLATLLAVAGSMLFVSGIGKNTRYQHTAGAPAPVEQAPIKQQSKPDAHASNQEPQARILETQPVKPVEPALGPQQAVVPPEPEKIVKPAPPDIGKKIAKASSKKSRQASQQEASPKPEDEKAKNQAKTEDVEIRYISIH